MNSPESPVLLDTSTPPCHIAPPAELPMPPLPAHVFRSHAYPVHTAAFSTSNQLLYAGDEEGWVTITDLRAKRVVAHWRAHEAGVLAVTEWQGGLVSHGRDNIIHFHGPLDLALASMSPTSQSTTASSTTLMATSTGYRNLLMPPRIIRSLPVNSLNFCGLHLISIPTGYELDIPLVESLDTDTADEPRTNEREKLDQIHARFMRRWNAAQGLLAVPNLTDSETIDIYHVPSFGRLHAAVSTRAAPLNVRSEGKLRTGLVMSTHLYFTRSEAPSTKPTPAKDDDVVLEGSATRLSALEPADSQHVPLLRLVAAFEDGRLEQWECANWSKRTDPRMRIAADSSSKSGGWRNLWTEKGHNEAIMAMAVSPTLDYAYTVSADHQVVKYGLQNTSVAGDSCSQAQSPTRYPTKQIGNSAVAVSPDGRVVAVGGWDGRVRLYSAKTFKSLGTLAYHRQTCHAIAFPNLTADKQSQDQGDASNDTSVIDVEEDDEDSSGGEDDADSARKVARDNLMRWMATGGKDRRVALWELKDFSRR